MPETKYRQIDLLYFPKDIAHFAILIPKIVLYAPKPVTVMNFRMLANTHALNAALNTTIPIAQDVIPNTVHSVKTVIILTITINALNAQKAIIVIKTEKAHLNHPAKKVI